MGMWTPNLYLSPSTTMRDDWVMGTIRLRYLGHISDITGKKEEKLDFRGATLLELLHDLCVRYGEKLEKILFDPATGSLRENIIILVNQRPIGDKLDIAIHGNSTVSILPFVSGG